MRKTIPIETLISTANKMLADSGKDAVEIRKGVMNLTEALLFAAGRYKGYRYLLPEEVKDGPPGINYEGRGRADIEERFAGTDRTRVSYF